MLPRVGRSWPCRRRRRVVFPDPLEPVTTTSSPGPTARLTSSKTPSLPKLLANPVTSTSGRPGAAGAAVCRSCSGADSAAPAARVTDRLPIPLSPDKLRPGRRIAPSLIRGPEYTVRTDFGDPRTYDLAASMEATNVPAVCFAQAPRLGNRAWLHHHRDGDWRTITWKEG